MLPQAILCLESPIGSYFGTVYRLRSMGNVLTSLAI